jgi:hypothetical protein
MSSVYVTKYALTDGIQLCELDERASISCHGGGTWVRYPGRSFVLVERGEFFDTLEEAEKAATT